MKRQRFIFKTRCQLIRLEVDSILIDVGLYFLVLFTCKLNNSVIGLLVYIVFNFIAACLNLIRLIFHFLRFTHECLLLLF